MIRTALSDRQVASPQAAVVFLNKEAIPLLREMRAALNSGSGGGGDTGAVVEIEEGDTSDSIGLYKAVWESDNAPAAGVWALDALVLLNDGNDAGAVYRLAASYRLVLGVPTLVGSTALVSQESTGAFDWQWSTTASTVILSVRDAGVAATYKVVVALTEVTP